MKSNGVVAWLFAVTTASAEVQLTMQNGRAVATRPSARSSPVARAATRIVNMERVPATGDARATNVREAQALDVLLRSLSAASGAARSRSDNLSCFDHHSHADARPRGHRRRVAAPVFQQNPPVPPAAGWRGGGAAEAERGGGGAVARPRVQYVPSAAGWEPAAAAYTGAGTDAQRPERAQQRASDVADAGRAVRRRGRPGNGGAPAAAGAGTGSRPGAHPPAGRTWRSIAVALRRASEREHRGCDEEARRAASEHAADAQGRVDES